MGFWQKWWWILFQFTFILLAIYPLSVIQTLNSGGCWFAAIDQPWQRLPLREQKSAGSSPQLCLQTFLYLSARAFITNCYRLSGFNIEVYLFTGLEGHRLEVQGQGVGRFAFFSGLSPWLSDGSLLSEFSHDLFLCLQIPGVFGIFLCVQMSSYRTPVELAPGPQQPHFNLITSLYDLSPNIFGGTGNSNMTWFNPLYSASSLQQSLPNWLPMDLNWASHEPGTAVKPRIW